MTSGKCRVIHFDQFLGAEEDSLWIPKPPVDLRTVHKSYLPLSYEGEQAYGNSWGSARNRGEKAFISHQGNHTEVDIRNWIFSIWVICLTYKTYNAFSGMMMGLGKRGNSGTMKEGNRCKNCDEY